MFTGCKHILLEIDSVDLLSSLNYVGQPRDRDRKKSFCSVGEDNMVHCQKSLL